MKQTWFLWMMLLTVKLVVAQDACPEFPRLMAEAGTFAAHKDYRKALNKYNSAKTCSPTQRAKVDSMIKELFDSIQAESNKTQVMYVKLQDAIKKEHIAEHKTAIAEGKIARDNFAKIADRGIPIRDTVQSLQKDKKKTVTINANTRLTNLPKDLQAQLAKDFVLLKETGRELVGDSLISAIKQLAIANYWTEQYKNCSDWNERNPMKLTGRNGYIPFFGSRLQEYYYYLAAFRLDNASQLLPSLVRSDYSPYISRADQLLNSVRTFATQGYLIPDKIIGLPRNVLFYNRCADNANFVLSFIDDCDYNKLQLHFVNYSLPDLVPTVDSSQALADSGKVNDVLAASAHFKNVVGRSLTYALKKNEAELKDTAYVVPTEMGLFDNMGKIINRFDPSLSSSYYFSPDGNLVVTWDAKEQLLLYNVRLQKLVPLVDNTPIRAMTISTDSRTIAYYNPGTHLIYFSTTDGQPLFRIPLAQIGQTDLNDIEFTGNDHFLRLNAADSILLFDISARKILLSFGSQRVQDIVVSPNGEDILLNCNITYNTTSNNSTNSNYENLALIVDKDLRLKGKLLSDVQHLSFTPDGRYVIGHDFKTIARWNLDSSVHLSPGTQSCLSTDELIVKNYFPYSRYASIDDASQIETGARAFLDLAESDSDVLLQRLYYRESKYLFDRLAAGYAKNIRSQRVPFFLDWYNWIEQRLGNKDFNSQFYRQKVGTELFDKMVNSSDSIYPRLLFYAANSHRIFGLLYDRLGYYNYDFIDLIRGEIDLRERVLVKDPDDTTNNKYLGDAYIKFISVCNIIGDSLAANKHYFERLALYRMAEEYLSNRRQLFREILSDLKVAYASALSHLASSFIYVYASKSDEYKPALDSASYYASKGLQIAPDQLYVVYFVMEDAFAHLLNDEVEKAINVCSNLRREHPDINKETMREAFQFFKRTVRSAGSTANTDQLEKFIEQGE